MPERESRTERSRDLERLLTFVDAIAAVAITLLALIALVAGLFTLVGTQLASGLADLSDKAADGFFQVQTWMADGPLHLTSDQVETFVSTDAGWSAASDTMVQRVVLSVAAGVASACA